MTEQAVEERVEPPTFALCSRLYASIAVASVVLSFLPLSESASRGQEGGGSTGTLWEIASYTDGVGGWLAVVHITFVILLTFAANRVRSRALPIGIAVTALVLVTILFGLLAETDPAVHVADSGVAYVALLWLTLVTAAGQAGGLTVWKAQRRARTPSVTPEAGHQRS